MKTLGKFLIILGGICLMSTIVLSVVQTNSFVPGMWFRLLLFSAIAEIILGFALAFEFIGISKKIKNGPLVVGRVVLIRKTGLVINDDPQIEFTIEFVTEDGRQITATSKKTVPLTVLPEFQGGIALPIRYDPKNPQKIMIAPDADNDQIQHALDRYNLAAGHTTQEEIDIRKNGVKTKGVVVTSNPTGNIVNDCGELEMKIKVIRPDGGSYEASLTQAVLREELVYAVPGSAVCVYYMPDDEKNIIIDFFFNE